MPDPPPSPKFGRAVILRRKALGYRQQNQLVAASIQAQAYLNRQDTAAFVQSTLSRLEDDHTGQDLRRTHPRILLMLSFLLCWSAAEFWRNVGITIPGVPLLDDQRDPAGAFLRRLRGVLEKSEAEILKTLRQRSRKIDLSTLRAIEAGVSSLAAQPLSVREAWRRALYLSPEDWDTLTGIPAPASAHTPAPPARIAASYQGAVGALVGETLMRAAHGFTPEQGAAQEGTVTLPVLPLTALWPPQFPQRGERTATHTLPAGQVRPGQLLTVMPDAALPAGPRAGHVLVVDTAADTLTPGQVYVVQPGNGPLVVRRAVLDAAGEMWLLPDVLDFQTFAPIAPGTARVIGQVDWFFPPDPP